MSTILLSLTLYFSLLLIVSSSALGPLLLRPFVLAGKSAQYFDENMDVTMVCCCMHYYHLTFLDSCKCDIRGKEFFSTSEAISCFLLHLKNTLGVKDRSQSGDSLRARK